MNRLESDFFLILDNRLSRDHLRQQREQISNQQTTLRFLSLLEAQVPIPSRALLLPAVFQVLAKKPSEGFLNELSDLVSFFEEGSHRQLGGSEKPLLLTIRGDYCGAIRNLGMNPQTLPAIIHEYGAVTAYGLYIDFLESYSKIVLGIQHIDFRKIFGLEKARGATQDPLEEETEAYFLRKVREYQNLVSQKTGRSFTDKPEHHLLATLIQCCRLTKNPEKDEIFIQTQVLKGNFGQSTQGVVYTRNPFTGEKDLYGVYQSGDEKKKYPLDHSSQSLKVRFPTLYNEMVRYLPKIEASCRDVMEVDFVSDEHGSLFFSQFERAETAARAAVVSTIELNREGMIRDNEAALRLKATDLEQLLHPSLDESSRSQLKDLGSSGVTAAPGTAVGHVFFKMKEAMDFYQEAVRTGKDKRVILITDELLISDTPGLGIIQGLITKASGLASHASVMARANGIPCIVGYRGLEVSPSGGFCQIQNEKVTSGTLVTLEAGKEGRLYLGEGKLQNLSFKEGVVRDVVLLLDRVTQEERIPLEIRVNINNPKDAEIGLSFGAAGVGLCRTENMFMESKSLREIRNIVFSAEPAQCAESFKVLEEIQFQDFKRIFEIMRNRTVNIRLMDLPLHDFTPQTEEDFERLLQDLPHLNRAQVELVATSLHEHNPMLGLRACRYGILKPEVYDMQIRAIVRAAYAVDGKIKPGILFPLVLMETELRVLRERVRRLEEQVREALRVPVSSKLEFRVGAMIELPGAALNADQLAQVGDFFAFGTNDLTQTTLGISRDDSAHYLPFYLEKELITSDPFRVLSEPVKELVETAVRRGRRVRPDSSFGICGEQGGDRATLEFCLKKGLNYVSCSPFRVLLSKLALIQVAAKILPRAEKSESQTPSTSYKGGSGPSPKQAQAG